MLISNRNHTLLSILTEDLLTIFSLLRKTQRREWCLVGAKIEM